MLCFRLRYDEGELVQTERLISIFSLYRKVSEIRRTAKHQKLTLNACSDLFTSSSIRYFLIYINILLILDLIQSQWLVVLVFKICSPQCLFIKVGLKEIKTTLNKIYIYT